MNVNQAFSKSELLSSINTPLKKWRAPLYASLVFVTAFWGALMMLDIISTNQLTVIEPIIFILFSI